MQRRVGGVGGIETGERRRGDAFNRPAVKSSNTPVQLYLLRVCVVGIFVTGYLWFSSAHVRVSSQRLQNAVRASKTPLGFDAGGLPFSKTVDPDKHYDVCLVGAGISGAVMAERYASVLGKTALVMDVRTHIGGNCYDFIEPLSGILMN